MYVYLLSLVEWFTWKLEPRNILRQNDPAIIPSDNIPDKPIFRHNATAVYALEVRSALAAFRTPLALFSNVRGQASLSTLQNYPFDKCVPAFQHFPSLTETPLPQIYSTNFPVRNWFRNKGTCRTPDRRNAWRRSVSYHVCGAFRHINGYIFHSGFQAVAERTPIPGRIYSGVISEAITISRSRLLKAYVLIIVVAVCALSSSPSPVIT